MSLDFCGAMHNPILSSLADRSSRVACVALLSGLNCVLSAHMQMTSAYMAVEIIMLSRGEVGEVQTHCQHAVAASHLELDVTREVQDGICDGW